MKNVIDELFSQLNLENNVCFKEIIQINDNELHIKKSKFNGGSTVEVKELVNIHQKLEQFEYIISIQITENEIILKIQVD